MVGQITRNDIIGRKSTNAAHIDSSTEAIWSYGVEGIERLTVMDVHTRRTRQTARHWHVDGVRCANLDEALAVLNGEKPVGKVSMDKQPEAKPAEPKSTLSAQIAEIELEIQMRREVYARSVSNGKMRKSEADYKIKVMSDARDSLYMIRHILPFVAHRCEDVIAEARTLKKI